MDSCLYQVFITMVWRSHHAFIVFGRDHLASQIWYIRHSNSISLEDFRALIGRTSPLRSISLTIPSTRRVPSAGGVLGHARHAWRRAWGWNFAQKCCELPWWYLGCSKYLQIWHVLCIYDPGSPCPPPPPPNVNVPHPHPSTPPVDVECGCSLLILGI